MTPEIIQRHFVPSMPMLLNWFAPWGTTQRQTLPSACQFHPDATVNDGRPVFGQSFFDDSAIARFFQRVFGISKMPVWMRLPSSCTYAQWLSTGCKFGFTEPISGVTLNVRTAECVRRPAANCDGARWNNYPLACV